MRIVSDKGAVFPESKVGDRLHPRYKGHIAAASVDRTEIVFFKAKGGVWAEYARYFREFLFKNKSQEIFINEER